MQLKLSAYGVLLLCLVSIANAGQRSVFEDSYKPQPAEVKILAISSSIHAGANNRETYLAEISLKHGDRQLVNLVDLYPTYGSRISMKVLEKLPILKMRVTRDPSCDMVASAFFLSDKSVIFDGTVRNELARSLSNTLPCFRSEHRSTKLKTKL